MTRAGVVFAKDWMVNYGGAHRWNKVSSNEAEAQRLGIDPYRVAAMQISKRTVLKRATDQTDRFAGIGVTE